jgi:hypothetical protein
MMPSVAAAAILSVFDFNVFTQSLRMKIETVDGFIARATSERLEYSFVGPPLPMRVMFDC